MYLVFIAAFLSGLVVEIIAFKQDYWRYRKSAYLAFNIAIVFTLVQGGIAYLCVSGFDSFSVSRLLMFSLIGSAVGVGYELCNEFGYRLFDFGSRGVLFMKSKAALIFGVGIAWGGVPLFSSLTYWFVNGN